MDIHLRCHLRSTRRFRSEAVGEGDAVFPRQFEAHGARVRGTILGKEIALPEARGEENAGIAGKLIGPLHDVGAGATLQQVQTGKRRILIIFIPLFFIKHH